MTSICYMVSLISSHYFERSELSRLLGKIVMIMVHEQSVYVAMIFMAKVNTIIDNPRTQAKANHGQCIARVQPACLK